MESDYEYQERSDTLFNPKSSRGTVEPLRLRRSFGVRGQSPFTVRGGSLGGVLLQRTALELSGCDPGKRPGVRILFLLSNSAQFGREVIFTSPMGRTPYSACATPCYLTGKNLLLLLVGLLLLCGGGRFYFGGPVIGGSGPGLVLAICIVVYLLGGFLPRSLIGRASGREGVEISVGAASVK